MIGLRIGDAVAKFGDVVDDMAVGDEQIEIGVIVEVIPVGPEAHMPQAGLSDTLGERHVIEDPTAEVAVQGVGFQVEVGNHDIEALIAVEVSPVRAHACFGLSVGAERHPG